MKLIDNNKTIKVLDDLRYWTQERIKVCREFIGESPLFEHSFGEISAYNACYAKLTEEIKRLSNEREP